ncbi:MAG: glycosyltransferase [Cyanobacteria bacterium J06634_5]
MRILFLDQSSKLGGAELCLADIAHPFKQTSLVGVFSAGTFPDYLRQQDIPVKVLAAEALNVQKESGLTAGLKSLHRLIPLIATVTQLSKNYDLIYANTPKALVVGAIASLLARKPLVYHLHDIVSPDHFSATNRRLIMALASRASLVIANSHASRDAFIKAGGRPRDIHVVYNSFDPKTYENHTHNRDNLRQRLARSEPPNPKNITPFVVGHFSRLSPWKGQHVLINALQYCPENVIAWLVGDALFGEDDYVQYLRRQVRALRLEHRVKFFGFRTDIPQLMTACDLVAHTSTAPEPFGRVIVEAMLCGRPVVAAAAGGALEIVNHGQTGWLTTPEEAPQLAEVIQEVCGQPENAAAIAKQAQAVVQQKFHPETINQQIHQLLNLLVHEGNVRT